ncbi:hypothetical protein DdX_06810 [Ditylenchus destructor]|uniref:Uncharacterized protein n=1 Tax=Ditylenchus destructor TaxID=166010 RepID=A0AAD4N3U1_9BILA|nr:hypothetical protein DdX_06810 [Ditylenchus destructor]
MVMNTNNATEFLVIVAVVCFSVGKDKFLDATESSRPPFFQRRQTYRPPIFSIQHPRASTTNVTGALAQQRQPYFGLERRGGNQPISIGAFSTFTNLHPETTDACSLKNEPMNSKILPVIWKWRLLHLQLKGDEKFTLLTSKNLRDKIEEILKIVTDNDPPTKAIITIKTEEDATKLLFSNKNPDAVIEILRQGIGASGKDAAKFVETITQEMSEKLTTDIQNIKIAELNSDANNLETEKLVEIQRLFLGLFFLVARAHKLSIEGKPNNMDQLSNTVNELETKVQQKDDCDNTPIMILIDILQAIIKTDDEEKFLTALTQILANLNDAQYSESQAGDNGSPSKGKLLWDKATRNVLNMSDKFVGAMGNNSKIEHEKLASMFD